MEKTINNSYSRALKRVKALRGFYKHLVVFVVANIIILALKMKFSVILVENGQEIDENFLKWLNWNVIFTPLLWGIGLLIHGISVFKFRFFKQWEERQIEKFMNE